MVTISLMETASFQDQEISTVITLLHQESAVNVILATILMPTQGYVLLSILSAGLLTKPMETVLPAILDTHQETVLVEFQL